MTTNILETLTHEQLNDASRMLHKMVMADLSAQYAPFPPAVVALLMVGFHRQMAEHIENTWGLCEKATPEQKALAEAILEASRKVRDGLIGNPG